MALKKVLTDKDLKKLANLFRKVLNENIKLLASEKLEPSFSRMEERLIRLEAKIDAMLDLTHLIIQARLTPQQLEELSSLHLEVAPSKKELD